MKRRSPPRFEIASNPKLIEDCLRVIQFQINRKRPCFFRVARESHLVLLRSMVETLKGTANLSVTGRQKDKTRTIKYQLSRDPWKEIHKVAVPDCENAWRYSPPTICTPPPKLDSLTDDVETREDYLIDFYDLLARVQTECFMCTVYNAQRATITDEEVSQLGWLHESVRNEFEHYIPRTYMLRVSTLLMVSSTALRISEWLLYNSGKARMQRPPRGLDTLLRTIQAKVLRSSMKYVDS